MSRCHRAKDVPHGHVVEPRQGAEDLSLRSLAAARIAEQKNPSLHGPVSFLGWSSLIPRPCPVSQTKECPTGENCHNFALRVALAVLAVYERSRVRAPSTHTQTAVLDPNATIVRQSGGGRFVIVKGPDRGESVPVHAERPVTFGSGNGNDVVLSDPTVSRRHLQAEWGEEGVLVRDLGSTNGSYVQGARFKEMELRFGAEIHIGKTVLKYLPEEEVVDLPPAESQAFGKVLGWDPEIRKLFRMLGDVAPSEATVLIEGETGTGKELLAEEIHAHSKRSNGPFVVFDCGAVPRELIESALFGHLRGAFTGAVNDRRGAFVEADGGTLFIDEIGELAPEMQPALLRAIDRRMVRPLGAPAYQQLDVRIIAATNRSL